MSDLVTVYAAIGRGNHAKAYGRGRDIGYLELRGSQTHHNDAYGRRLGDSEWDGGAIALRTDGGRSTARYRAR